MIVFMGMYRESRDYRTYNVYMPGVVRYLYGVIMICHFSEWTSIWTIWSVGLLERGLSLLGLRKRFEVQSK